MRSGSRAVVDGDRAGRLPPAPVLERLANVGGLDPRSLERLAALLVDASARGLLGKAIDRQLAHAVGFVQLLRSLGTLEPAGAISPPPVAGPGERSRSSVGGDVGDDADGAGLLGVPNVIRGPWVVDVGSGAGLPGLVVAIAHEAPAVVLVESRRKAVQFVRVALRALELEERCMVVAARAEQLGRMPRWRERCTVVTARAVARPAVVAELIAGLLAPGGMAIVSEPPASSEQRSGRGAAPDHVPTGVGRTRAIAGRVGRRGRPADRWPSNELASLGLRLVGIHDVSVGIGNMHATLAQLEKVGSCPDHIPRGAAALARRPRW
jgi:hypothetical protein